MKKNFKKILHTKKGSVAMISLLAFLGVSLAVIFAFSDPLIRGAYVSAASYNSKESYYVAESLAEDIVYRLNHSMNVSASESLDIGESSASASITDSGDSKDVTVVGDSSDFTRTIKTNITTAEGVSFNYGVQAGSGGFDISGGSKVIGNIYANGNITGSGGAIITGSAVAADDTPLTADQTNASPVTPTQSITFGNASASQDFAQSFKVSSSAKINKVQFFIKKNGSPANETVRIVNDNAGSPGTTNIVTGTLTASLVTTSYGWIDVIFSSNPTLTAGTTYWLVIDGTNNSSKYYTIGANSTYTNGQAKVGQYSGTWNNTSPSGLDGYFTVYLGGTASTLGGGSYVGALTIGSGASDLAWANTVTGVSVSGPLYCLTGSNNNKSCNTSRPNPSTQPYPISDANIAEWKDSVTDSLSSSNIYNGNLTINYAGTTSPITKINGNLTLNCSSAPAIFGDLEVTGNLTIGSGCQFKPGTLKVGGTANLGSGILWMKGNVWVVGNVTLSSGGSVKLDSSLGSSGAVFITDGTVNLSGGGVFSGTGQSGSYVMLLTTSTSASAMTVTGGAGAVVLSAIYGTINFSGGTAAKAAVANRITLTGGTTITYDSGLQNPNFSNGPSGSWAINSWKEAE